MGKPITTLRELGAAIGRSHTSARRWVNHDAWPWSRRGPWDTDDVPRMLAWAANWLSEDHCAEARADDAYFARLMRDDADGAGNGEEGE